MMVLQAALTGEPQSHTGWWVGLVLGFVIVSVVVVLVALILMYAARIVDQAVDGIGRMGDARDTTFPVWQIQDLNENATGIWQASEVAGAILREKM